MKNRYSISMENAPAYTFSQIAPDLFEQVGAENRVCPWVVFKLKYIGRCNSVRVKFSSGVVRNYNWISDYN